MEKYVLKYTAKQGMEKLPLAEVKDLKGMYKHLTCNTITIGAMPGLPGYSFIADDEGLFIEEPLPVLLINESPYIHNGFIVTSYDEQGEQVGLTDRESQRIGQLLTHVLCSTQEMIWNAFSLTIKKQKPLRG